MINPYRAKIAKSLRDGRCFATVLVGENTQVHIHTWVKTRNYVARALAAWALREKGIDYVSK